MRKTKRTRPVIGVDNAHRRLSLKAKKQGWPFITLYTNNGMGKPVRGYLQKEGPKWLYLVEVRTATKGTCPETGEQLYYQVGEKVKYKEVTYKFNKKRVQVWGSV